MRNERVTIGYEIFEKKQVYNHEKHYHYIEDDTGKLYKAHYGHDGDQDWHITFFENVETGDFEQGINEKYYYEYVGRTPFKLDVILNLNDMVGKELSKEIVEEKVRYGFVDYDSNTFYILSVE